MRIHESPIPPVFIPIHITIETKAELSAIYYGLVEVTKKYINVNNEYLLHNTAMRLIEQLAEETPARSGV